MNLQYRSVACTGCFLRSWLGIMIGETVKDNEQVTFATKTSLCRIACLLRSFL